MSEKLPSRAPLALDGHRPAPSGVHRPTKVQGGYRPPTSSHGAPPTGGSGAGKPQK